MFRKLRGAVLVLGVSAWLAACGNNAGDTSETGVVAPPIRVLAAASLTDVLKPVAQAYAEESGKPAPVLVFASSSELARQIEQGAEADVFISADEAWMDYVEERRLIDPVTRRTVLTNTLVLIAPSDQPFALTLAPGVDLAGTLGGGKLAMGDPDSVPAGRYAREALTFLGAWDAVAPMTARAESVRAALRFVETGEAAAGIVYLTDALAAGDAVVQVDAFPAESHTPITYPAVATATASEDASRYLDFLGSAPAARIFEQAGFGLPSQ